MTAPYVSKSFAIGFGFFHTLFNQPQVLVLALDDTLEILDILSQLFHLCLVELFCLLCGLFDVETGSDVYQDGLGAC